MSCLLDIEIDMNCADIAINKKWLAGKVLNPVYRDMKAMLRADFLEARIRATTEPVAVELEFGAATDIDAPLKCIFDALEKSVLANDKQIEHLTVSVVRSEDAGKFLRVKVFEL